MAAKTNAEPAATKGTSRHSRRREVSGILLLAGGIFAGLALMSMHVGGDPLLGPGRRGDRVGPLRARRSRRAT